MRRISTQSLCYKNTCFKRTLCKFLKLLPSVWKWFLIQVENLFISGCPSDYIGYLCSGYTKKDFDRWWGAENVFGKHYTLTNLASLTYFFLLLKRKNDHAIFPQIFGFFLLNFFALRKLNLSHVQKLISKGIKLNPKKISVEVYTSELTDFFRHLSRSTDLCLEC